MTNESEFQWRPTTAPGARRYDDIWFLDAETGWTVNSDGHIRHTIDGGASWPLQHRLPDGVYPRCIAFSNALRGWVGTLTPALRMLTTDDGGATWSKVANLPPEAPARICGMSVVNERVVFASGTNIPRDTPGFVKTGDGGATWTGRDMSDHASILIDCYFTSPTVGWVVGGRADAPNPPSRNNVKPVVLHTTDGGETWVNRLAGQEDRFPPGEWGWKIQFVSEHVGFVSLENLTQAAILRTDDGGLTWSRKPVNDPQMNANLEGVGFVDASHGWVGGWGDIAFASGKSSETADGGENWTDANQIGLFLNRFRFIGNPLEVAYASGDTVYKYSTDPIPVARADAAPLIPEANGPARCGCLSEIGHHVPSDVRSLRIDVWDSFGESLGCHIQSRPRPGRHTAPATMLASVADAPDRNQFIVRFTTESRTGERDSVSRIVTVESLPPNSLSRIKIFLDEGIEGNDIGAHGAFWRGLSRDDFVAYKVFGFVDLVSVGDGSGSNLVKALRGEGFQQMPRGFPPLPAERIAFIEAWIDDGAPSQLSDTVTIDSTAGSGLDPVRHNHYWREFDNWAAFHRSPEVNAAIGPSFQLATVWADFVRGRLDEPMLLAKINEPLTKAAVTLLATRQMQTIEAHYGNPTPLMNLLQGYELFGRGVDHGGLPEDPLRPGDPHQMNGPQMWFNWSAMADACLRLDPPIQPVFWRSHIRAILLGLMNDGVLRGRFPVDGFSAADPDVSQKLRDHVVGLSPAQLSEELAARYRRTSFNLPFG
jgi:photosystem II stability/assembly factor-like uncharacterized protein